MARVKVQSGPTGATDPNVGQPQTLEQVAANVAPDAMKLVTELEKADAQAATDAARAAIGLPEGPAYAVGPNPTDLLEGFLGIQTRVFAAIDFNAEYDAIEAWIKLGDKRTEEAFIRKLHEESADMLQRAHRLYTQAKLAREKWEAENAVVFGAMREQASEVLEQEKASGKRKKAITEADVDGKCAAMFPDAYVSQEIRRKKAKATEDSLKFLVETCGVRARHLDTMMHKLR